LEFGICGFKVALTALTFRRGLRRNSGSIVVITSVAEGSAIHLPGRLLAGDYN
jgi:hypothetical protein